MSAPTSTQKPLRVGVFYENVQMADLACLDILGDITPELFNEIADLQPAWEHLKPHATPMEFLYIASSMDLAWTTPKMYVKPTHTYESAPRDLDILLIGGPNPTTVKEESLAYLREAMKQTKVILTTCTGSVWLARSGALDGKKATRNRTVMEIAKNDLPEGRLAGAEQMGD